MKLRSLFQRLTAGKIKKSHFFILILLMTGLGLFAQSRKELERQRRQKEQEIEQIQRRLEKKSEKKEKTLQDLDNLKLEIDKREEYIGTLQNQLHLVARRIEAESDITAALDRDIDSLKKEYGKLMYFMYKRRGTYNTLSYIFASSSFNEAVRRAKFLQFYIDFRQKQIHLIKRTEESLSSRLTELKANLYEKNLIFNKVGNEKQALELRKSEEADLAKQLKKDEKRLTRQLEEKRRTAEKLDRAISRAIEREIAQSTRSHKSGNNRGKGKNNGSPVDDDHLSSNFADNKSRMPWPLDKGYVCERFGRHEVSGMKNVYVEGKGIKMCCNEGDYTYAVFDGIVTQVIRIPNAGIAVIIRHGDYFTVYSNLQSVIVNAGDHIKSKDMLGKVGRSTGNNNAELDFQIWKKGGEKLDPEKWLSRH